MVNQLLVTVKKCNWNLITWHKSNPIPACGNKYLTDTEYCLFFREPGVKVGGSFETKKSYYVTPINAKDKKEFGHPTIKPLDIIENLIVNSSEPGDLVLDCFMGSGTTCLAAKNLGREYIGFELAPDYFEVAKARIGDVDSMGESVLSSELSHSNALHKSTAFTQNRLF